MNTLNKACMLSAALAALFAAGIQAQAPAQLTSADIVQRLESQGYTAIDEIEKDDGQWEVEATSPKGQRVDLVIDPVDGRIVRESPDKD